MLIVVHIIIALSGIIASTVSALKPSQSKIYATYGFTLLTILTGTILVFQTHSPLLGSCITGLIYISVSLSGTFVARRRLASQKIKISDN